MTKRTLIVTNDFPPRPGGIQAFVHGLASRRPPGSVVVYAPRWKGCEEFDARQPYEVVRHPSSLMLPTRSVAKRAAALVEDGATVVFGAAAPLGLLAPVLRAAGAGRIVMLTHGHEASWARLPGARALLRRIGAGADVVTYLGDYTRSRIAQVVSASRLVRLAPGVDTAVFRPGAGGDRVRASLGLDDRPVVVCVSRLVPRKGQDVLLRAWPLVLRRVPGAVLLLVGGGPSRRTLERTAARAGLRGSVVVTGSVPWASLPAYYDAGDVFAMPCRSRLGGSTSRVSASSTWRRRPPDCRWSRAPPAAPPTPYGTARRAWWSTARRTRRWPAPWATCWPTRPAPARWGSGAGPGSRRSGAGTSSRSGSPHCSDLVSRLTLRCHFAISPRPRPSR
ncbi:hypothetical protein GCM10027612_37250 [Microbispora bryophytorum subsp. camponoti]